MNKSVANGSSFKTEHKDKANIHNTNPNPPLEVPEHIYLAGEPRILREETKPTMIVPERIVLGVDTSTNSEAKSAAGINARIKAFPQSKVTERKETVVIDKNKETYTPFLDNRQCTSRTSISVERDPLNELRLVRRRLRDLALRVQHLEMENGNFRMEKNYLWTLAGFASITALAILFSSIKSALR